MCHVSGEAVVWVDEMRLEEVLTDGRSKRLFRRIHIRLPLHAALESSCIREGRPGWPTEIMRQPV